MATILGLFLMFLLGTAIGAWAAFDWLRYRGVLSSSRERAERLTASTIEQLLNDYNQASPASVIPLVAVEPDSDDAA